MQVLPRAGSRSGTMSRAWLVANRFNAVKSNRTKGYSPDLAIRRRRRQSGWKIVVIRSGIGIK
jgi:hypothetical protein